MAGAGLALALQTINSKVMAEALHGRDAAGKMATSMSETAGRSARMRRQLQQLSRKGDSSMQIDENQADMERRLRSLNDLNEEIIEMVNAARNTKESTDSESRIKRERLVLLKEKQMHTQKNVHNESQTLTQMENSIESLKNQCASQVIEKANFLDLVKDTENQRILAQKRLESRKLDLQKQKSIVAEFEHALNHARQSRKRLLEELELVRKELESVHAKNVSLQHERSVGNTRRGIADFKREEPALLDSLASLRKDRMRLERELKEYMENLENETVKCNSEKENAAMWLNEADKAAAHCAKREEAALEDQNRLTRVKEISEEMLREKEQLEMEFDRTENEIRMAKENLLSKQRQTKTLKQVGAHLEERLKAEHASLNALQEKRDALCEKIDKVTRDTPSLRALARQEEEKRIRLVEEAQEVDQKLEEMRRRASSIILGQENGPPPGTTTLSSSRISSRPGSSHPSRPGSSNGFKSQTGSLLPKADSRARPSTANLSAFSGGDHDFSGSQRARPSTAGGIAAGGIGMNSAIASRSGLQFKADSGGMHDSNREHPPQSDHWPAADYRRSQPSQTSRISSANQDWKHDDFRHSSTIDGSSSIIAAPTNHLQQETHAKMKPDSRSDYPELHPSSNHDYNLSKGAISSSARGEGGFSGLDSFSNPVRQPSSGISTSIAQQFSALQERLDNAANFTDDILETVPKKTSEQLGLPVQKTISHSSPSFTDSSALRHTAPISHFSAIGSEVESAERRVSAEAQQSTFLRVQEPRVGLAAAQTASSLSQQQPIKVSSLKVSNELETLLKRMEAFAQDVDVDANKLSSSATRAINANREVIANAQESQNAQNSPAKLSSISNHSSGLRVQAAAATSPEKNSKDIETQLQERAKLLASKAQHEKQLAEIRAAQDAKFRQYAQANSFQHRLEPVISKSEAATPNKSSAENAEPAPSQVRTGAASSVPSAAVVSAVSNDELSRIRDLQSAKFLEAKTKQAAERLQSTMVHPPAPQRDSQDYQQLDASVSGMQAMSQADLEERLSETAAQRDSMSFELDQHDAVVEQKLLDSSMEGSISQTLFRGIFDSCRHNKMSVSAPPCGIAPVAILLHLALTLALQPGN